MKQKKMPKRLEQKVPRVEQKFHLSHFVETKYLVTTNRGHGTQKWQPIRIPESDSEM